MSESITKRAEAAIRLHDAWLYFTGAEPSLSVLGQAIDEAAALLQSTPDARPVGELTQEQRKAAAICLGDNKVSISMVQRKLGIGYSAAQELCQSIIDAGVVPGLTISPGLKSAAARTQPERVPLTDVEISLMAHNEDSGDWNDLNYRDCWHKGYEAGARATEAANGITESKN